MGRKAVPRLREQLDPSGSTAECDKTNGQPVMECAVCGMRFRKGCTGRNDRCSVCNPVQLLPVRL